MNAVLVSVLVVSAVCLVSAQGPGGSGPPPRGGEHGGRGAYLPGLMMKFNSCKSYNYNTRKKWEEMGATGPSVCKGNREDCWTKDALNIRCAIEDPSDECIQDVNDFMSGNRCSEVERAQSK